MDLNQQVCSLELAKKLEELGVPQDSLFYWVHQDDEGRRISKNFKLDFYKNQRYISDLDVSAFTVAELGEMLPSQLNFNGIAYYLTATRVMASPHDRGSEKIGWVSNYSNTKQDFVNHSAKTEVNARAKMLVYLLENKLYEPPAK